jgi:hypothetical protein
MSGGRIPQTLLPTSSQGRLEDITTRNKILLKSIHQKRLIDGSYEIE